MPDLSTSMLHGSAAESSSSKWLSLLSASSFPVVSLHHQLSAPKISCFCRSVLRGSFYQMRGIKCLKVRDLEAWGITERYKWPRDLPGFEPGTFRLPGVCNPVGFKLHPPRMTCSSVGNSPGKWEEYCALPLALITVQRLSISLDVSCWQWGCWRWSPVRSGFESSCPTLPWKSKHGTEKRPIPCANH